MRHSFKIQLNNAMAVAYANHQCSTRSAVGALKAFFDGPLHMWALATMCIPGIENWLQ